jgi:hypothetical protein
MTTTVRAWSDETRQAVDAACRAVARDAARLTPDGDLVSAHLRSAQSIMAWSGTDNAASRLYRDLICGDYCSRQEMHERLDAILEANAQAACDAR